MSVRALILGVIVALIVGVAVGRYALPQSQTPAVSGGTGAAAEEMTLPKPLRAP